MARLDYSHYSLPAPRRPISVHSRQALTAIVDVINSNPNARASLAFEWLPVSVSRKMHKVQFGVMVAESR